MSFNRRSAILWTTFLLFLLALGWSLHAWMPAEPRWTLHGEIEICGLATDGETLAVWEHAEIDPDFVHLKVGRDPDYIPRIYHGALVLHDARTGKPGRRLFVDAGVMTGGKLSPDGRFAVAGVRGGKVCLANTRTGAEWQAEIKDVRWDEVRRAVFTPDGEHLAIPNGPVLTLVETRTGRTLRTYQAVCDIYRKIASTFGFTRRGKFFVCETGGTEKEPFAVCVWEIRSGHESKLLGAARPLVTDDGKTLIVAQSHPQAWTMREVLVWDLADHKPRGRFAPDALSMGPSWRTSYDGRMLATWEYHGSKCMLAFWDLELFRCIARTPIPSGTGGGHFSPDARLFFLAALPHAADPTLTVYDPATANVLWKVPGSRNYGDRIEDHPFFGRDSNAVIAFRGDKLHWRDAVTGDLDGSLHLPVGVQESTLLPSCRCQRTPDLRFLLIHQHVQHIDRVRGTVDQFLNDWLLRKVMPGGPLDGFVSIVDISDAREVTRVSFRGTVAPLLSEDGQTLLLQNLLFVHEAGGERMLTCWDVPARKPFRYALGVPIGLAGAVIGFKYWRKRSFQ